MKQGQILCPTDFSPTADLALDYAIEFAKHYGVGVQLVNVIDEFYVDNLLPITPSEILDIIEKNAKDRFVALLAKYKGKIDIEAVTLRGLPSAEILSMANQYQPKMITIANHGSRGLSHFLHFHISEDIARKAKCPVLVVK